MANDSTLGTESKDAAVAVARLASSRVSPIEGAVLRCELASHCYRLGMISEAAHLIQQATADAEKTDDAILSAAVLASVAAVLRDCGKIAESAESCNKAYKILSRDDVHASALQEATLGKLYAELGLESASREIAEKIVSRAKNLPDFLSQFATAQALRIYVALNDKHAAQTVLEAISSSEREHALLACAFDVSHKAQADRITVVEARWIAQAAAGVPLAVIMLWLAEHGMVTEVNNVWEKLRINLEQRKWHVEQIHASSLACLAFTKVKRNREARSLFDIIWNVHKDLIGAELPFPVRCSIAEILVNFGHAQSAGLLRPAPDDPIEGIGGAMVCKLVEQGDVGAALSLVKLSDLPRKCLLLFRCACAILKNSVTLSHVDLFDFRALASSLER
jgi:tetratricopeptide (TPR) repeat protein